MDRLTKSKEAALLEAEKTVQMALAKAALVDDLLNKNQELMKQIEICQVFITFECSPSADYPCKYFGYLRVRVI